MTFKDFLSAVERTAGQVAEDLRRGGAKVEPGLYHVILDDVCLIQSPCNEYEFTVPLKITNYNLAKIIEDYKKNINAL